MAEQGSTYATFVEEELKLERERWQRLDGRGTSIVGASAGFASLITVVGVVGTGSTAKIPPVAEIPFVLSIVAFVLSGICGLVSAFPRKYEVPGVTMLERAVEDHWTDSEVDARNFVTTARVKAIQSLRRANDARAVWLVVGLILQLVAIAFLLDVAVAAVVRS